MKSVYLRYYKRLGAVFHQVAAKRENGEEYIVHPDSGRPIVGYPIPQWEAAKTLAAELAQIIPGTGTGLKIVDSASYLERLREIKVKK